MIAFLKYIGRHYWAELVFVPPFLLGLCYYFYGPAYLESWGNFFRMTLPWLICSVLSPICCHWVRKTTLKRFVQLEEWPKRVVWSIFGYLFFTVGFAKLTYFILSQIRYENLTPKAEHFTALLILSAMCVLTISTLYEGITYFDKWKLALTEAEQLEKLNLETQFQSLQSQLNPHFLFNSLNVLSSLIAENPKRAEDFVDELSNVYRYLLRSNEQELSTLGEELRFIRSFFHLLATRYDTGISMQIQVPEEHYAQKLPALGLQILVENAVKHNEISPEKPLNIAIFCPLQTTQPHSKQPDKVVVRNNLQRKATRPKSNYVGLDNLRQRYELLRLEGFEVYEDGRFFEVTLPLVPMKQS